MATRFLIGFAVFWSGISEVSALDCPGGGVSNTTAVRKTYPVPPKAIYPIVGDFFDTKWSTIFSFNYSGTVAPPKNSTSSENFQPNATRTVAFDGYEFKEQLIFINTTAPSQFFNLRWNLTNPPVTKDYTTLSIDGYIQDFKFTAACDGEASLMEWTVEYCSSNQTKGWDLFQNRTMAEADNLAAALNITGANDGSWDVGCALPDPSTTTAAPSTEPTDGSEGASTSTTSRTTTTSFDNGAVATIMPVYGRALALAVAAAFAL